MQLIQVAKKNALMVVVALLTIAAGATIGSIESAKDGFWLKAFATVLAVFGGALITKALEDPDEIERRVLAKEDEIKKLQKARLLPVNRHLASVTREVLSVVRKPIYNNYTAIEGLNLIQQQVPNLIGAMTDVGEVAGEPFDPNTIYETASQVEELARLLDSLGREARSPRWKAVVDKAKDTLADIHPDVYKRVDEAVDCPHCGAANKIQIGLKAPASAHTTCSRCQVDFHAHRKHDGTIHTSKPGSRSAKPPTKRVTLDCSCSKSFLVAVPTDSEKTVVCRGCGRQHIIKPSGEHRTLDEIALTEAELTSSNFQHGKLLCSVHESWCVAKEGPEGVFTAVCHSGPHALRYKRNQ